MKTIVLLRHGQSTWNKDNRFTGWTDVDLTERGAAEAREAGRLIKEAGREPIERDTLYRRIVRDGADWRAAEPIPEIDAGLDQTFRRPGRP